MSEEFYTGLDTTKHITKKTLQYLIPIGTSKLPEVAQTVEVNVYYSPDNLLLIRPRAVSCPGVIEIRKDAIRGVLWLE
jgi:hypothetical protein